MQQILFRLRKRIARQARAKSQEPRAKRKKVVWRGSRKVDCMYVGNSQPRACARVGFRDSRGKPRQPGPTVHPDAPLIETPSYYAGMRDSRLGFACAALCKPVQPVQPARLRPHSELFLAPSQLLTDPSPTHHRPITDPSPTASFCVPSLCPVDDDLFSSVGH